MSCAERRWSLNLNLLAPLYRLADLLRYRRHRNLGKRGEDLAHRYLRKQGFIIAARNWRPPQGGGEIDIVAWDEISEEKSLVFVEVKTRATGEWSAPERAINAEKIQALRRTARDYIRRSGSDPALVRFDAISISSGRIEHLRDAFRRDASLY
jgi:putative endonuclease